MTMPEPLIFLGAGSSSPLGIPTMKEMVYEFEKELEKEGSKSEQQLYRDVKSLLEKRYNKFVDLELVFSLIEEISQEITFKKLGDPAFFYQNRYLKKLPKLATYKDKRNKDTANAKKLKDKFEKFIKVKCQISLHSMHKLDDLYSAFFNQLSKINTIKIQSDSINNETGYFSGERGVKFKRWSIFTTNYDQAVEIFCTRFGIDLNTGFKPRYHKFVLNPQAFTDINSLSLFKLHGSLNWIKEDSGQIVSHSTPPNSEITYDGRQILGEVMVYPITEKLIYRNPFTYMFYQLNERLKNSNCWVIIGYSFRDTAIKNLFLENATEKKKIILLHPNAEEVIENELSQIPKDCIFPLNRYFGEAGVLDDLINIIQTN